MKFSLKKIKTSGASWDSMFLAMVKIVTTGTGILEAKILSDGLSLTEYGTYSHAHLVISVCTSMLLLGLIDAINYFYNNKSGKYSLEERRGIIDTIYAIELAAGMILALLIVLFRNQLAAYFDNPQLPPLLLIVALKPLLANLLYFHQTLFVSVGKAKIIAIRNLILSLIAIAVSVISIYLFHSIDVWYAINMAVSFAQLLILTIWFFKKEFVIRPYKPVFRFVKTIMKYAWPMAVYNLTGTLTRDVDRLVIGRLCSTEASAIYTNCSKILPFDIISVSFATVLIPFVMRYITGGKRHQATELFKNYIKIGYYSVFTFAVGTMLVVDQVIPFLYTSEYLAGREIFMIYIIDSMLKFASVHLVLVAYGKTTTILCYSLAALTANVGLNIGLYYLMDAFGMGMVGPALATLIVTAAYSFAILAKTKHLLQVRWNEIFDFVDLLIFCIKLAVTGTAGFFLNMLLLHVGVHRYIAMLITLAVFAGANLLLSFKRIKGAMRSINYNKQGVD